MNMVYVLIWHDLREEFSYDMGVYRSFSAAKKEMCRQGMELKMKLEQSHFGCEEDYAELFDDEERIFFWEIRAEVVE